MRTVYLTFDDGPDENCTPHVLQLLAEFRARATFFLIGNQIAPNIHLARRIVAEGHAIGNHSWDHRYHHLFSSKKSSLQHWIMRTEQEITDQLGVIPVGFRPPAGIVTPPLKYFLRQESIALIMWHIRFFDAIVPWVSYRFAMNPAPGSIVLLHDAQRKYARKFFLNTLRLYLQHLQEYGYDCAAISSGPRSLMDKTSHS